MPLFDSLPVDLDEVKRAAHDHWGLEVSACLKASQNHTYSACRPDGGRRYALRVTPDPSRTRQLSIVLECRFLLFLSARGLRCCAPAPSAVTQSPVVRTDSGRFVVCAFPWAEGEPVVFGEYGWITRREHAAALGRWMARLHDLSRQFAAECGPEIAGLRGWRELHDGVLADVPVDAADVELSRDPRHFGIIHGDINVSNYHWVPGQGGAPGEPCVFDWDQVQQSWFLYDVAQPIWGVVMLAGAGSPLEAGKPVPEADPDTYQRWIVEGYESYVGSDGQHATVDLGALARMVRIRRELYGRFCRRALREGLDPQSMMGKFCTFVVEWLDRASK
eukprot:m51a1_g3551 hypothetical protein (333) ;mRNA; r:1019656-1020734